MPDCGISEPGTAPSDSRNSSISATRIEVSWRQNQRAQPSTSRPVQTSQPVGPGARLPPNEPGMALSTGAVESWEPAAPRSWSSAEESARGVSAGESAVVLLIDQIPTVKPSDQPCMSCTSASQAPVSSSTPVTIIMVPPTRITQT